MGNAGYLMWRLARSLCLRVIQIHCRGVNPTEKHINLSGYYPIINVRAGFYGRGPAMLTVWHRAYLNRGSGQGRI